MSETNINTPLGKKRAQSEPAEYYGPETRSPSAKRAKTAEPEMCPAATSMKRKRDTLELASREGPKSRSRSAKRARATEPELSIPIENESKDAAPKVNNNNNFGLNLQSARINIKVEEQEEEENPNHAGTFRTEDVKVTGPAASGASGGFATLASPKPTNGSDSAFGSISSKEGECSSKVRTFKNEDIKGSVGVGFGSYTASANRSFSASEPGYAFGFETQSKKVDEHIAKKQAKEAGVPTVKKRSKKGKGKDTQKIPLSDTKIGKVNSILQQFHDEDEEKEEAAPPNNQVVSLQDVLRNRELISRAGIFNPYYAPAVIEPRPRYYDGEEDHKHDSDYVDMDYSYADGPEGDPDKAYASREAWNDANNDMGHDYDFVPQKGSLEGGKIKLPDYNLKTREEKEVEESAKAEEEAKARSQAAAKAKMEADAMLKAEADGKAKAEADMEKMAWKALNAQIGETVSIAASSEFIKWNTACKKFFTNSGANKLPAQDDGVSFPVIESEDCGFRSRDCVRAEKLGICQHDMLRVLKGSGIQTEGEQWVERLKRERLRWHPDRFCNRMGKRWEDEAKEMFQLVQVLVQREEK